MKKIILIVSGIISVILGILIFVELNNLCNYSICRDIYNIFVLFSFIFPFVFFFSFITYFLKDQIFQTWFKFSRIWVPISILLTIITPGGSASFFVSLWDKQMTAIVMSGLYIVISLMIIIIRSTQEYLLKKKTL